MMRGEQFRFLAFLLVTGLVAGCSSDVAGPNRAPLANAGPDMVQKVGQPVDLDGSGSFDPDGDGLHFQWDIISAPAGATAEIANAQAKMASIIPDEEGIWAIRLVVSDTRLPSEPDVMQLRAMPIGCKQDKDCIDDIDCTTDTCDTDTHQCLNTPNDALCPDDGVFCNGPESCDAENGCVSGGDPCPSQGLVCDEAGGQCRVCVLDGDCDDGVACTTNTCDAGTCLFTPDDAACPDDGNFCNGPEICDALTGCVGSGDPCSLVGGSCDEDHDLCSACGDGVVSDGQGEQCDPAVPASDNCCDPVSCTWTAGGDVDPQGVCSGAPECKIDVCDGAGGCSLADETNGAACTGDGVFCNGIEECQGGSCVSPGNPCAVPADCDEINDICQGCGDGVVSSGEQCDPAAPAGDHCCDPATCQWVGSGNVDPQGVCAGVLECQLDVCDGSGGCTIVNVADGTACTDDGVFCNGDEQCLQGACQQHTGNPCPGEDGDDNCAESCNEGASDCTAADTDGAACDDNLFCNGTDSCQAGTCSQHVGSPCPGSDGDSDCAESCNEGASDCTAADPDSSACDDGVFCNGTDSCLTGACTQHGGNPCPGPDGDGDCAESCNEGAGDCSVADPDNSVCNDGLFCTVTDTCQSGTCTGSGNPCPGPDGDDNCAESCNEGASDCTAADPDGVACNDNLFCNGTDSCQAGACSQHGGNPCPGPDGDNDCGESCNEGASDCTAADPDGAACNDGVFCNGSDSCQAGACFQHGGDPCPGPDGDANCAESCNEGAGDCTAADTDGSACADDGLFCTGPEQCQGGSCNSLGNPCTPPGSCDDINDLCAGCGDGVVSAGEQCDPVAPASDNCCDPGSCQWTASGMPDPQLACSVAPECQLDVCDGSGGCTTINDANGIPCTDDGFFCTGSELCQNGSCTGSGNPCPGPDGDNNCAESCNEGAGDCTAADPDSAACDDSVFCNGTDSCLAGACSQHGVNPCPGPDGDNNCAESCNEGAGDCTAADPDSAACDDSIFCNGADSCLTGACSQHGGNPCPGPDGDSNCAESCNEGAGDCTLNDPDSSVCDDSLFCNGADSCLTGACSQHGGNPCPGPDGDSDCAESCNEGASDCTAADPDSSVCNDGLFCTVTDTCQSGLCTGSGNPCPGPDGDGNCAESCNEGAGDCTLADPDSSVCDDSLFCNGADSCLAGACSQHGGNPCPGPDGDNNCAESCNEGAGDCTLNDPDASICDDSIFCNGADSCQVGACSQHGGNPCPGPDGDNDCAESCDELADNCLADDPNGSACDDLLYCTLTDTCTAGACGGTGNPCPGPDGDNDCAESCDELADNCLAGDPNGSACDDGIDCTSPAPGNDTCDGLGVCSGIPDNLYCDTFVALGDLCYPSCSPDTSGCVTPPGSLALTCENPVYLDVDTVSDCSITLAGGGDIIGQEACLSCSASVGVTTLINTDFEDDLNPGSCAPVVDQVADGWTIVSGTSCYGTGTSCPMSNPNNRDCCDNLKCPIDLAGTIAFQADRDTCTSGSRQWRLQHTFDATGLQNIELCFDYAGNGATGDEILQIDLADASNYQPNVFCDDGGPTGGVNNIWFRTCVDLSAAAVFADNNPALRVIFFLHSNNGNDRIYIDNITLRGESISCPATTTTLTEDFSGCSDPLTDWNGWTVGGGATINCSPRFNCYDLSNRAWVNNTGGGVGEFYQYFDMSAVTDVELCFYYGENGANGGEIVTVDVDSGLGWQTQWSNEGNFGANNTCAQVCLNLSDLDPAVDHNANAGIRIQLEAGDHEIDLDQIVFSGHQDCTVPAVVSLGNPQDPDNDGIYDFTATDTDGQLTSDITCQWDPDAMLSDWSRVWYRPLNLKPSNIQPERMCANSYDLDIGADATIDTDLGTITGVAGGDIVFAPVSQGGGFPNIGVFSFNSINIQSGVTVTVQGNNALALLSCTGVDIQGTLDASGTDGLMSTDGSCFSGLGGPGGYDGGQCFGSGPPNDGQGPGGGGAGGDDSPCNSGGAGGGFGGIGGAGGDGNDGGGCFVAGPLPAVPYGLPELVPLIGGSGGGCGGDDYGGPGGGGGGAVQLSAGGTLSVPAGGLILTAGGGGEGGHDGGDSGAGGGSGSGGAILLEAEFITIAGKLAANGGGGGAGFDGNPGWGTGVAASGQPGTPDESSALGGASTGMGGGDGGDGSGGIVPVGDTGLAAENGGGGGGGTGRIRINTGGGAADIQAGAIISPTGNLGQCTGICTQGVVEGW